MNLRFMDIEEVKGRNNKSYSQCSQNGLIKSRWVASVSCAKLFNNDKYEIQKANAHENDYINVISPTMYFDLTQNCSKFLQDRGYITCNLSKEEVDFPIAYSIMVYKAVYQLERLLRSIYRPQNYYCIHADSKMSQTDRKAIESIVKCFDNVFMSSTSYNVTWGTISSLQADIVCMKDLLRKSWKYFINLTGQEFPLQSNLNIVRILKTFNGSNDVKFGSRNFSDRWLSAGAPPMGLTPYKGRVHIIVNRDFVEYAVKNKTSAKLLKWLSPTIHPDETFFTTLNYNSLTGILGSLNGKTMPKIWNGLPASMARYKRWSFNQNKDYPCHGIFVRSICIPGVADLPELGKRPELFVNKLYWDFKHYVLDCLEELIHNRTVDGFLGQLKFNNSLYSNLYFVKHAIR